MVLMTAQFFSSLCLLVYFTVLNIKPHVTLQGLQFASGFGCVKIYITTFANDAKACLSVSWKSSTSQRTLCSQWDNGILH